MYKIDMATGESTLQGIEKRLTGAGVRVLHSMRVLVRGNTWDLSLLSPFWRLYSMEEEGAWVEWCGEHIALYPGRLYLIPAWVPFTTGTQSDQIQHYVHFDIDGFPASVIRAQFNRPLELLENAELLALAKKWRESCAANSDVSVTWLHHIWAGALVQASLACVMALEGAAGMLALERWLASDPVVQPALDLIEERLKSPPVNAELAVACGLGVDHFIRRFRDSTGLTPAQYGLERRVLVASRLLAESDRKIDDVAEATGFNDRFYFSRVFKAKLAVTPAVYRRVHRLERLNGIG